MNVSKTKKLIKIKGWRGEIIVAQFNTGNNVKNNKYCFSRFFTTYGRCKCGKSIILQKIQALSDFGDVKSGDYGGWIKKESDLSWTDDSWIEKGYALFHGKKFQLDSKELNLICYAPNGLYRIDPQKFCDKNCEFYEIASDEVCMIR